MTKTKSQRSVQVEIRCDLSSLDNLLRLFRVHSEFNAREGGTAKEARRLPKSWRALRGGK